jgi:hypothetical protein
MLAADPNVRGQLKSSLRLWGSRCQASPKAFGSSPRRVSSPPAARATTLFTVSPPDRIAALASAITQFLEQEG